MQSRCIVLLDSDTVDVGGRQRPRMSRVRMAADLVLLLSLSSLVVVVEVVVVVVVVVVLLTNVISVVMTIIVNS